MREFFSFKVKDINKSSINWMLASVILNSVIVILFSILLLGLVGRWLYSTQNIYLEIALVVFSGFVIAASQKSMRSQCIITIAWCLILGAMLVFSFPNMFGGDIYEFIPTLIFTTVLGLIIFINYKTFLLLKMCKYETQSIE